MPDCWPDERAGSFENECTFTFEYKYFFEYEYDTAEGESVLGRGVTGTKAFLGDCQHFMAAGEQEGSGRL